MERTLKTILSNTPLPRAGIQSYSIFDRWPSTYWNTSRVDDSTTSWGYTLSFALRQPWIAFAFFYSWIIPPGMFSLWSMETIRFFCMYWCPPSYIQPSTFSFSNVRICTCLCFQQQLLEIFQQFLFSGFCPFFPICQDPADAWCDSLRCLPSLLSLHHLQIWLSYFPNPSHLKICWTSREYRMECGGMPLDL